MSETTIRDLFRSLEVTLHERLRTIEDVMRMGGSSYNSGAAGTPHTNMKEEVERIAEAMIHRSHLAVHTEIVALREEVGVLRKELMEFRQTSAAKPVMVTAELIPHAPLEGIEIVSKRDVATPDVLSIENRLLLNKVARKALEAEEMGEHGLLDRTAMNEEAVEEEPVAEEEEEEELVAEEEEEEEEEEELAAEEEEEEELVAEEEEEEEAEEEEAEEEAEEVELEEFEYKGSTYYRDGDKNVFMTDEDGELMEDPIGIWSEAKQRIIVKKVST